MNLTELNSTVVYPYSRESLLKLEGVHPDMIRLAFEIAQLLDCKIIFGVRTDEEQLELFKAGRSTFDGTTKKSNHQPKSDGLGYALDILPLPKGVNMYEASVENKLRWAQFDGLVLGLAHKLGIKVKTGFKWRDNPMDSLARPEKENTLPDGNHIELIKGL